MKIEHLLQRNDIWQGNAANDTRTGLATGYTVLDEALGIGGWPQDATTELLSDASGIGELRLILPALARLSQSDKWITLVAPPHIPYAPALAAAGVDISRILVIHPRTHQNNLWVAEQSLKSGCCSAVLSWQNDAHANDTDLRRLQLAAKPSSCWHIQFRPLKAQLRTSPAALRLALSSAQGGLKIDIIKQQQRWSGQQVWLPLPAALQASTLMPHQLPLPLTQTTIKKRNYRQTPAATLSTSNLSPVSLSPTNLSIDQRQDLQTSPRQQASSTRV